MTTLVETVGLLINPDHSDFPRIRIIDPEPFRFDSRMWE